MSPKQQRKCMIPSCPSDTAEKKRMTSIPWTYGFPEESQGHQLCLCLFSEVFASHQNYFRKTVNREKKGVDLIANMIAFLRAINLRSLSSMFAFASGC